MDLSDYINQKQDDVDFCLEEVYVDIQEQLARLLEHQDVTQEELARRMKTQPSYVSRMLQGTRNITLKSLMKACVALEVRPEIFLQHKDQHSSFAGLKRFEAQATSWISVEVLDGVEDLVSEPDSHPRTSKARKLESLGEYEHCNIVPLYGLAS